MSTSVFLPREASQAPTLASKVSAPPGFGYFADAGSSARRTEASRISAGRAMKSWSEKSCVSTQPPGRSLPRLRTHWEPAGGVAVTTDAPRVRERPDRAVEPAGRGFEADVSCNVEEEVGSRTVELAQLRNRIRRSSPEPVRRQSQPPRELRPSDLGPGPAIDDSGIHQTTGELLCSRRRPLYGSARPGAQELDQVGRTNPRFPPP